MQASDAAVGMRVRSSTNTAFKGGYTVEALEPDTCDLRADDVVHTRKDGTRMKIKGAEYLHVKYSMIEPEGA